MIEKKVLLIEEEENILKTYSYLLGKEGYEVMATSNGSKAVETLHQQQFDIVITDLAIKIRNGCTVLEEVKAISPTIPVIVLTDNSSSTVRQFVSLLGAYGLIVKPCSYEFLSSCIRSSLSLHQREV
jgi:DNA-binding NtrC family response regulator